MSFQGLISGAECATTSNPLSQVLKHTEGDRSLQQDRIAESSSAKLHGLPGTTSAPNDHDLALARQFFEANTQSPGGSLPFAVPHHLPPPSMGPVTDVNGFTRPEAWSLERHDSTRAFDDRSVSSTWASEFGRVSQSSSAAQHNIPHTENQQRLSYMSPGGTHYNSPAMYGMTMNPALYQNSYNTLTTSGQGKGKENSRDADFEAAFAQVVASLSSTELDTPKIVEIEGDQSSAQEVPVNVIEGSEMESSVEYQDTEFNRVLEYQDSGAFLPKEDLAKWEADFSRMMNHERESLDFDYGEGMQQAWTGGVGDFQEDGFYEGTKFDDDGLPILGPYEFAKNNKYLDPSTSTRSFLAEAKALLEQNGSLAEAALLLETAIQRGDLGEGGYEAWILLGEARNMDEREEAGMRALAEGVRRGEAANALGAGMLSLAISYTNEGYDRASHTMLLRWLRARYPSHPIPEDTIRLSSTTAPWHTHTELTNVFLSLARLQHNEGIVDPDVQVGLGILFYANSEYDFAKDCFESALTVRPKDYLLWNRLGSSLSNGSKPEEALGAYREALQLRPTYTRAIYNVGVACLNLGAYKEAAEHFLSAVALQEATGGPSSTQLWTTLRRALLSMDRPDLVEIAKPGDQTILEVFRKEGFDFQT